MRTVLLAALAVLIAGSATAGPPGATPANAGPPAAVPANVGAPAASITGRVIAGVTYVDAGALATALGDVVTAAGGVLTWRGAAGVATLFLGSADALVQRPLDGGPDEWALSAPPLLSQGGSAADPSAWLLPLDAVQLLGVIALAEGELVSLQLPGGALLVVALASDDAPIAGGSHEAAGSHEAPGVSSELSAISGVPALRFFLDEDLSVVLLDLDLAPLAYPELTTVIDAAGAPAGGAPARRALVTSLRQREWPTSLVFEQDDLDVEVRPPYRFHLYLGADSTVAPEAPVAGVILLPPAFSLYKPIAVSWAGVTATVTFRR
jgi:hypothetical protein